MKKVARRSAIKTLGTPSEPRQSPSRFQRTVVCLAILSAMAGCSRSSGPARYELSGTVTHAGRAVPHGTVTLSPDTQKGNRGPASIATIRDGRFATEPGKGVVGGPYRLRIVGYDGQPVEIPGEGVSQEGRRAFPPYEEERELPREAGVLEIAVPAASSAHR